MGKDVRFYIGSCTWNYDSWVGDVYSWRRDHAADYLPEYAARYNTTGIDSWFYHIPKPEEAMRYKKGVHSDFRFTCKVPQSITLTHLRKKTPDGALVPNTTFLSVPLFEEFIRNIEPVLENMSAIILEFEYLNKQKMKGPSEFMEHISAFLAKVPKGLPYALELRNPNYFSERYFSFLRDKGLIPVLSEKIFMPHVYEVYVKYKDLFRDTVVIRLLGGDRKEIEQKTKERWDVIVDPKTADIEHIVAMIKEMLASLTVVINVNNHYEGSAPRTIEKILDLLKKSGVSIPALPGAV